VSQSINAGSATVAGVRSCLFADTFLPAGLLGGFGISANYGYTYSRANSLPDAPTTRDSCGPRPIRGTSAPTYDRRRLSMRLGLSYNQANIFSYQFQDGTGWFDCNCRRLNGPDSDNYLYSHLEIGRSRQPSVDTRP